MAAAAIVLCGGKSSRMGRPKALLPWNGKPMILQVVGVLREVVDEVVVVASADLDLPALEATIVRDREPGLGPLAGIREGLEAIRSEFAFVTGVDAPFLTPAFVRAMLSFHATAAPEIGGVLQPLGAVYAKSLAGRSSELIAQGRRSLLSLLEAGSARRVREEELPDPDSVRNLNTPEEYRDALRKAGAPRR